MRRRARCVRMCTLGEQLICSLCQPSLYSGRPLLITHINKDKTKKGGKGVYKVKSKRCKRTNQVRSEGMGVIVRMKDISSYFNCAL